ncbi:hypothetical protein NG798_17445 [Ancylothrix sp. C2]|uniref:hypothetical protein n=1 Tax=Ancylothrix sp. D3o TaxID=2953691 RepID=UPI0021BA6155|nr:hypothetical protein [Ancylothrix sp. D3o]MCT7951592.1 hypothetical protein [Ancylothrix sp. D3o]
MNKIAEKDSKAKILETFYFLLVERKKIESKVATKEEEAAKEQNKILLENAGKYTVDGIVKGLADLQLEFGTIVNGLSEKLGSESSKLEELKQAIEIEKQNLQEVQQIRVAADALYILTQEHQERLKLIEEKALEQREKLEKEIAETRKIWQKEQEEYEAQVEEEGELLIKQRQQEAEDFVYKLERQRKIETDEYENRARQQERLLQDTEQTYQKQWAEREKVLADNQALFVEFQQRVEKMPEELKKAEEDAKKRAIEDVNRDAKVRVDLTEKEWEKTKEGFDLRIVSLEATIQRQSEQIGELSQQLQETIKQAQELALRAFASTNGAAKN